MNEGDYLGGFQDLYVGVSAPNALIFPEDSPKFDSENFYRHDQTIRPNYVNAGIGFDYIVSGRLLD